MAKFWMTPVVRLEDCETVRLGTAAGDAHKDIDVGRFKKLVGESRYDDTAAGNAIEGILISVESATQDGFYMGTLQKAGRVEVILNGLEATPGVGTIVVGDYVYASAPIARGVAQTLGAPKVVKATTQATASASPFPWRLVSIDNASGGAQVAGTTKGIIERVC